jgi:hypothetical protein
MSINYNFVVRSLHFFLKALDSFLEIELAWCVSHVRFDVARPSGGILEIASSLPPSRRSSVDQAESLRLG